MLHSLVILSSNTKKSFQRFSRNVWILIMKKRIMKMAENDRFFNIFQFSHYRNIYQYYNLRHEWNSKTFININWQGHTGHTTREDNWYLSWNTYCVSLYPLMWFMEVVCWTHSSTELLTRGVVLSGFWFSTLCFCWIRNCFMSSGIITSSLSSIIFISSNASKSCCCPS